MRPRIHHQQGLAVSVCLNTSSDLSRLQQQQQHGELVASGDTGGKGAKAVTHTVQLLARSATSAPAGVAGGGLGVLDRSRFGGGCGSGHEQLL